MISHSGYEVRVCVRVQLRVFKPFLCTSVPTECGAVDE